MNTPHKHADSIKLWADGAIIQHAKLPLYTWKDVADNRPEWHTDVDYRAKPSPHKWQHLIDAQAAGKACQMRSTDNNRWNNGIYWDFDSKNEYRLKPETVKYRNLLWRSFGDRTTVLCCTEKEQQQEDRTKWLGFIRWIGEWQEAEL